MSLPKTRIFSTASALLAVIVFQTTCTDIQLEPPPATAANTDSLVSVTGTVCTTAPKATDFPVKVLFIVDQSGSMCISDPPGSSPGNSFCNGVYAGTPLGQNLPPVPGRVRAIEAMIAQFKTQPNVSVAVLPFETNPKQPFPTNWVNDGIFADPNVNDPTMFVAQLQNQLGNATDYQGVLAAALTGISIDVQRTQQNNPEILPRTKYVIVFLTDGTPYPRCTANPNLPPATYANPLNPAGIYSDQPPDMPVDSAFCAVTNLPPNQQVNGYNPDGGGGVGTDRNQNYQLFSYVQQLMDLKKLYNVGDVKFNSVLLFNVANVQACGPMCQDVYGYYPNFPPGLQYSQGVYMIAKWLLQQMAALGNGVYIEFQNQAVINLSLGALDYTSLLSRNVMKQLLVRNMSAIATPVGWDIDSDWDGISDTAELTTLLAPNQQSTSPFNPDSDGDCFNDSFETIHGGDGFNPIVPDTRGCVAPLYSQGIVREDTDGDGLDQYEEAQLGTDTRLVDSDADSIPDGLAARYGLNPLVGFKNSLDTDGDGIPDREEIRAGSNPLVPDVAFYRQFGYQYSTVEHPNPDGSTCYDYTVSNIRMVPTPAWGGLAAGYNLLKVYFAQAPESGAATDYGVWSSACAWALYNPPLRAPLGPDITLPDPQTCAGGAPGCYLPTRLTTSLADYRNPQRCLNTCTTPGCVPP